MELEILDIAVLVVLLISVVAGAWRGLTFELLALLGWVLAFFGARTLVPDVVPVVRGFLMTLPDAMVDMLAFVLTFTLFVFVWGLLSRLTSRLIASAGLRPIDRVMGGAFGALRCAVLVTVLGLVVTSTGLASGQWWRKSHTASWTQAVLPVVLPSLPALRDLAASVPQVIEGGVQGVRNLLPVVPDGAIRHPDIRPAQQP